MVTACANTTPPPPGNNPPTSGIGTEWLVACDGVSVSIVEDSQYLAQDGDDWSLKFKHQGGCTSAQIGTGIKLKNVCAQDLSENVSVYVFNPTEYDYQIEVFCHEDFSAAIFQDYQQVEEYTVSAGQWTEITISAVAVNSTSNNGVFDVLGIAILHADNGGANSAKWQAVELYFNGLSIFTQE